MDETRAALEAELASLEAANARLCAEVETMRGEIQRLRSSNALGMDLPTLVRVVECVADAVEITDLNQVIQYVNPAFERMTGYSLAEACGKTVAQLVRSDYHEVSYFEEIYRVIGSGQPWRGQLVGKHRSGRLLFQAATVAPVFDDTGTITHYVAIKRDLSEQREVEQARDAALELARVRSEFVANVSHELRTPLNGIHGALHLLQASPLDPEQAELVRIAGESSQLLLRLINDVLDFSRAQSGKLSLEEESFDLGRVLDDVRGSIGVQAVSKGLTLSVECHGACPHWLKGDQYRLRQVLLNLLGNAIKFTSQGEVRLEVRAAGPWLEFRVSDSGIGLVPSARERIFQPFEQADASTTRQFGGSGLGLAICLRIVSAMGGAIGVTDNCGGGCVFHFEIPLVYGEARLEPRVAPRRDMPVQHRILVAEDNVLNQRIMVRLFRQLGYEVTVVENGLRALQAVEAGEFSLVFMDCQMPVMDGFEAAAGIRSLEGPKGRVPIVALTAQSLEGDKNRCVLAGMDDYVSKPFQPSELERVVKRFAEFEIGKDAAPQSTRDSAGASPAITPFS